MPHVAVPNGFRPSRGRLLRKEEELGVAKVVVVSGWERLCGMEPGGKVIGQARGLAGGCARMGRGIDG